MCYFKIMYRIFIIVVSNEYPVFIVIDVGTVLGDVLFNVCWCSCSHFFIFYTIFV